MRNIILLSLSLAAFALLLPLPISMAADNRSDKNGYDLTTPFFDKLEPDWRVLSKGRDLKSANEIVLQPTLGISHYVQQQEIGGSGYDDVTHKVQARAGGKVNLYERFYLGIVSKIPIYNYEFASPRMPGGLALHPESGRHDYELFNLSSNRLTWTGEMGLTIGQRFNLNLYYDQNLFKTPNSSGRTLEEEVIGTRFIFRFR